MAVTEASKSIVLTAVNDVVARPLLLDGLFLSGTGMTAGGRLTIQDNRGSIVTDHYVVNANEAVEFLMECKWVPGLKLTAVPAGGTWTVVARLK